MVNTIKDYWGKEGEQLEGEQGLMKNSKEGEMNKNKEF